MLKYEQILGR